MGIFAALCLEPRPTTVHARKGFYHRAHSPPYEAKLDEGNESFSVRAVRGELDGKNRPELPFLQCLELSTPWCLTLVTALS